MKRMLSIIMLLFFLVSVSGVNVNIHYCDSELVGMTVNGIHFKTDAGQKMADCCNENTGCPMCKHVAHHSSCTSNSCKAARHRCILCSWPTIGFMA